MKFNRFPVATREGSPAPDPGPFARCDPMAYTSNITRRFEVKHLPELDRGHRGGMKIDFEPA
jgi:hypothetical protein